MTKEREALKLALEALEGLFGIPDYWTSEGGGGVAVWRMGGSDEPRQAITAIKEALAQPDAFEQGRQEGMKQERALWELSRLGQEIEAQPVQEPVLLNGLTEAETNSSASVMGLTKHMQPEQEPVARVIDDGSPEGATEWITFAKRVEPLKTGDLLYTAPPQRPWVGLTDDEIYTLAAGGHSVATTTIVNKILKGKNNG